MADRWFQPSPDYGGEKQLHVAALLPFVLPAKSLTINSVADVADFPDLHINLACRAPLRGKSVLFSLKLRRSRLSNISWLKNLVRLPDSAPLPPLFAALRLTFRPRTGESQNREGSREMRAVADTNVLLAGLRSRNGASHELLRLLSQGRWTLLLSNTLLTEYQEILHREQAHLPYTHEEIERLLDGLCSRSEKRRLGTRWWPVLEDADDEMMVHLAVESRADCLITHNVRHLQPAVRLGVSVMTPREFLRELRKQI
jgi:putative PIN family toxin of toxin-antitoxin system